MADLTFLGADWNANDIEDPFAPLPEGDYLAEIAYSIMEQNKAQTGAFLKLTLKILQGDYAGRELYDRLNLENPSEQAVKIAERQLASICKALGIEMPKDSRELHNKPLVITLSIDGSYNRVTAYKKAAVNARRSRAQPAPSPTAAPMAQTELNDDLPF